MDRKTRKNKKSYTAYDMFRTYRIENNDVDTVYSGFKRILTECNEIILDLLLNRSEGFKMPSGLGYVRITKHRPIYTKEHHLVCDYHNTKKYNSMIFFLNEHSNGYRYKFTWIRNKPYTYIDKQQYMCCLTRANKRRLAQLIFNRKDYIDQDDIQIY